MGARQPAGAIGRGLGAARLTRQLARVWNAVAHAFVAALLVPLAPSRAVDPGRVAYVYVYARAGSRGTGRRSTV
jgi:hypothetical protein